MTQPEKTPSPLNPDLKPGQPLDLDGIPIPEMSLEDFALPGNPSPPAGALSGPEEEVTEVSVPDFSFEELLKDLGETRPSQPVPSPKEEKTPPLPEIEVRLDMLDGLDLPELQLTESGEPSPFPVSASPAASAGVLPEEPPVPVESIPIPELSLDDLVEPSVPPVPAAQPVAESGAPDRESDLSQFDGIELLDLHLSETSQPAPGGGGKKPTTETPEPVGVESVPIPEMSLDDLELPEPQPAPVAEPSQPAQPEEPVLSLDLSGLDGVELPEVRVFSLGDEPVAPSDSRPVTPQPEAPKPVARVSEERVSILEPALEDLVPAGEIVSDTPPVSTRMEGKEGEELQEPDLVIEAPHPSPSAEVSPLRRKSVLNPAQATTAFKSLFAQNDVPGILSLYEAQVDSRVKRLAVDWLVKHAEELGIAPLLSIGSIETDEEMFRYMMREILKLDRGKVCKLIEVETCPRPLLQVAVMILSELGLRSALPKLQKCVEGGDAVVRSVALHGIGRSGEAAEPLVPFLLKVTEQDADKNVRVAAAKALQAMNSLKAYEAFEQKAHEVSLDPAVAHVLEELRAKFDPTGENRARLGGPRTASKTSEKGTSKPSGKGSPDQGKAAKLAVVVLVILAAIYFLYQQLLKKG